MAEAARKLDFDASPPAVAPVIAAPSTGWSGEVHGPVAALHQAIEAGLADYRPGASATDVETERPVDRLLRLGSRATGWAALTVAFAVAARAIL